MRQKVFYLINSLGLGGAETLVTSYALNIDKEKFEPIIVSTSGQKGTINEKKLFKKGIKVIFLNDHLLFQDPENKFKIIINKVYRYFIFRRFVIEEKPDIVHGHLNTTRYLLFVNSKKNKIKLYYTIHSHLEKLFGKRKRSYRWLTKYLIKNRSMQLITLHSNMKKEADKLFNINNSLVINNAIELDRFKEVNVVRKDKLKLFNIQDNKFIVGHVGRFAEPKNHEFLIEIFSFVKDENKAAHLILIGEGILEKNIKEKVSELGLQDSVSFLGNRKDIPELMKVMDVFVFPSLHEGFGNVLVEAQATNLRCVISKNVPNSTHITNLITPLSLNDSIEKWSETIVNAKRPNDIKGDLSKHDIKNVIKDLETLYLN